MTAIIQPILPVPGGTTILDARTFLNSVWASSPTNYPATISQILAGQLDDASFQSWLSDPNNDGDIQSWCDGIKMQAENRGFAPGSDEFAQELWLQAVGIIGSSAVGNLDYAQIEEVYIQSGTVVQGGARSTEATYPAVRDQILRSRGHVTGVRQWDPDQMAFTQVPVLDEDVRDQLHEAGRTYFAGQVDPATGDYYNTSGVDWDWARTSEEINKLNIKDATTIWDMASPQQALDYSVIWTTNEDGSPGKAVAVPTDAITRMQTYLSWASQGQVNSAMIAGVEEDVPWENILFVADALNQLDPIIWEEGEVDETTGAVIRPAGPSTGVRGTLQSKVFTDIAGRLNAGLRLYDNDEAFAILHAVNPNVARTIRADGAMTADDIQTANDALKSYMGFTALPDSPAASWTAQYIMNLEPTAPEPAEEREVSEAEVRESYRELYKSWFMADPTDDELDKFSDYFDEALSTYQRRALDARPNRFDLGDYEQVGTGEFERGVELMEPKLKTGGFIEGQPALGPAARDYLRADDMYGQLYSKKPSGMTEEGYLGIMQESATSTLGRTQGALAQGSIQAGMISGDPKSVGRHAVYSGAGDESATLRGRMAKAGNILRRMT